MWAILALAASLFWGLSYIATEQIYTKMSVATGLGIMSIVVGILMLLLSLFWGTLRPDLEALNASKNLQTWLAIGTVVLLLAEFFIGTSIVSKNATLAGLIEISYPLFIALFSYIIFKNQITWATGIGSVIIFFGVFIVYRFNI